MSLLKNKNIRAGSLSGDPVKKAMFGFVSKVSTKAGASTKQKLNRNAYLTSRGSRSKGIDKSISWSKNKDSWWPYRLCDGAWVLLLVASVNGS